jgi:hypothetical protein
MIRVTPRLATAAHQSVGASSTVRELRAQGRRSLDQATIFAAVLEQRKILDSICKPSSRQRQKQERRGRAQNAGRPSDLDLFKLAFMKTKLEGRVERRLLSRV